MELRSSAAEFSEVFTQGQARYGASAAALCAGRPVQAGAARLCPQYFLRTSGSPAGPCFDACSPKGLHRVRSRQRAPVTQCRTEVSPQLRATRGPGVLFRPTTLLLVKLTLFPEDRKLKSKISFLGQVSQVFLRTVAAWVWSTRVLDLEQECH